MDVILQDVERGCGTVKKNGVYLIAEKGLGGTLSIWTWLLGCMLEDELTSSIFCDGNIPPRTQIRINPQETLRQSLFWPHEWGFKDGPTFNNIPIFGLADHVGSNNYTPISFAKECQVLGPSRRISRDLAGDFADKTPFPIFFAHSDVPVWKTKASLDRFTSWALLDEMLTVREHAVYASGRTWDNPTFGFGDVDYHGNDHLGIALMAALDEAKEQKLEIPKEAQPVMLEAFFGASWVTKVIQVKGEDEDVDENLAKAGVYRGIVEGGAEEE